MQLGVTGRRRIQPQLELADGLCELPVQLLPFAHPQKRQVVLTTPFAQLISGQRFSLFLEDSPQIQHGHKVGTLVGE